MTYFLVMIIFSTFALMLQSTGIMLLQKKGDRNISRTQKYLITTISLTDITYILFSIVLTYTSEFTSLSKHFARYLVSHKVMVLVNLYYFTMFGIIIDRFMQIKLSITYELYWNKERSKKLLLGYFVMLNLSYFAYLMITLTYQRYDLNMKILEIFQKYIKPIYCVTFVTAACSVYFYIFRKIYYNRKKHERIKKNVGSRHKISRQRSSLVTYLLPFWIIIAFILFQILPDAILTFSYFNEIPHPKAFKITMIVLYNGGFIADLMIYIFNLRIVRNKLKQVKARVSMLLFDSNND